MVIGTIKCSRVCECALQTKRPINDNLKWPQDHESASRGRSIGHQGLRRRTFSLSQAVTKPRVKPVRSRTPFAAFSSISCLYFIPSQAQQRSSWGWEGDGREGGKQRGVGEGSLQEKLPQNVHYAPSTLQKLCPLPIEDQCRLPLTERK